MKKIISIFCVTLLIVVVASTVCVGCNEAEHKFAKDWSYDETYHYRVCTDNGCNEKKDKAEHVFGEWTVNEEASTTNQGLKERVCGECGYKKRETIPMVVKSERTIKLKSGVTFDKVYDGNAVVVSADNFEYDGGGEITFMFARNGSEEWFSEVPKEIGKYTVKVTVAETETHKGTTGTFGFEIKKTADINGNYKNFTVTDANGKAVKLSDFIGKPIVINFWAAWCAPRTSAFRQTRKRAER